MDTSASTAPIIETLGSSTSAGMITAVDPYHRYYAPLFAEFIGSLAYTLFCKQLL
jgi:hypothetical protein